MGTLIIFALTFFIISRGNYTLLDINIDTLNTVSLGFGGMVALIMILAPTIIISLSLSY